MRLMFVTPAYRPSFFQGGKGGGEISNQILLNALAQKGLKVYVISMLPVTNKTAYRDGCVRVIEPFATLKLGRATSILAVVFFKIALSRIFCRIKPNTVLSTTSVIKVTSEVSRLRAVRHGGVVRAMENLPGYGWKWSLRSPKSLLKLLIHKATIGWPGQRELDDVDFIVANSEFLKDKYLSVFPGKPACVVYPALDVEESENALPDDIRRVMMVGISRAKGFDIFKKLASLFPALEFHAIGDRALKSGETRREDAVFVHGWMSDPISFIDEMDMVLVPSRWEEPFGRIAIEALSRRKFVLVSGKGGLPETVSHVAEIIVPSDSIDEWHVRMERCLNSVSDYQRLLDTPISRLASFDLEAQAGKLDGFLRSL